MWILFEPLQLYVQRTEDPERFRVAGFCERWGLIKDTDKEDWAVDVDLAPLDESQIAALFNDVPYSLSFSQLKEVKSRQYGHKFDIICACRLYEELHKESVISEQLNFI